MEKTLEGMGEPRIKVVALPKDTNSADNIFGGWIMSQIDLAGAQAAREIAPERVVTISMQEIIFKQPVFIGDVVSCYAKIVSAGNTSIKTKIEVTAPGGTMASKIPFILGLGAGYVLGTRAGRAQYERIKAAATRIVERPSVRNKVDSASTKASNFVRQQDKAVTDKVAEAIKDRLFGGAL